MGVLVYLVQKSLEGALVVLFVWLGGIAFEAAKKFSRYFLSIFSRNVLGTSIMGHSVVNLSNLNSFHSFLLLLCELFQSVRSAILLKLMALLVITIEF